MVALLRGVNIGGRRLNMAALRSRLTEHGCADVETYIQSGNIVLTPPHGHGGSGVRPEHWFEAVISELAGYPVPVVLRTAGEMAAVVEQSPFPDAGGTNLHVLFFADEVPDVFGELDVDAHLPERHAVIGRELYLLLPNGIGRATLPVAIGKVLRRAKASEGTARNWNTVLTLQKMAAG